MNLRELNLLPDKESLARIPEGKVLINTINAWSFVCAQDDDIFAHALKGGDYLIPDGISIVKASRFLRIAGAPKERITGADLFAFEMNRLNRKGGICMFMGSSENVLTKIKEKASNTYPNIQIVTYSPPYKQSFTEEDNHAIISAIHAANPDLLWIGMTAPKQEKWAFEHWKDLHIHCHCGTIGAVFDFFAGTIKRAPEGWQKAGLEWLYRLLKEPRRMWRRYIGGNLRFLKLVFKEKFNHGIQ